MKKTYIHTLVILLALLIVGIISMVSNNGKDMPIAYGYDTTCLIPGLEDPRIINDFETNHSPNIKYAPFEEEVDYLGWQGEYNTAVPYPTPSMGNCANGTCPPDGMVPGPVWGNSFSRIAWTGSARVNPQYIHLTNYANTIAGAKCKFRSKRPLFPFEKDHVFQS
jgi:hypothetical protein